MTLEEIVEFWQNQTLFGFNDLDAEKNVKPESMERIAAHYNTPLVPGKVYTFKEARDFIVTAESKKREAAKANEEQSEQKMTPVDGIVSFFKLMNQFEKSNNVKFVLNNINSRFSNVSAADVMKGIQIASEQGYTTSGDEILKQYQVQTSLRLLNINLKVAVADLESGKKTEEDIVNHFSRFLYQNHKKYGNYGPLSFALSQSSLPEEVVSQIDNRFYEQFAVDIEKHVRESKFRGQALAKDIVSTYADYFNMEKVFAIIDSCNIPNLNVDRLRYLAYQLSDRMDIERFLVESSKDNGNSAAETVDYLRHSLEYPEEYVIETIENMRKRGLVLPYDEILSLFGVKSNEKEEVEKPQINQTLYALLLVECAQKSAAEVAAYALGHFSDEEFANCLRAAQLDGRPLPYEEFYQILDMRRKAKRVAFAKAVGEGIKDKLTPLQMALKLKKLPNFTEEEVISELQSMKRNGLVLSVDEIIAELQPKKAKKEEEDIEALVPKERVPARLDLEKEEFVEQEVTAIATLDSDVLDADFEPISTGKRHKVVVREKAQSALDKKAVIAAIIVALGAVSTAVLSSIFGVSPLSAAKNTVTSIMSVASRNPVLMQLLPAVGDFVKNLAVFGTAAAGTIAWFKRRKNKKREQNKQEIAEVLEELLREKEEMESGGKTR